MAICFAPCLYARACNSCQKLKQGVPIWPPLQRIIPIPFPTKIQSVAILRKITSCFWDKEGRELPGKTTVLLAALFGFHLFLTGLEDLLQLHLAHRNIGNSSFPFSCCSSPLISVQTPPLREPCQTSAVVRFSCTSLRWPMTTGWLSPSLIQSCLLPNWLLQPRNRNCIDSIIPGRRNSISVEKDVQENHKSVL